MKNWCNMPKYQVYSEHKETFYAIVEADSLEDAEELADTNYSDYEWQKLEGSLAGNILIGETTKVKDE